MLKTMIMMAASLLLMTCPGPYDADRAVRVENKSTQFVGFQAKMVRGHAVGTDTLLQRTPPVIGLKPDTSRLVLQTTKGDWDDSEPGGSRLQVLVLNTEKYHEYWSAPLDTVRKYVPVLQRYLLTRDDLERLHWTVTYPPTPQMQHIEMYPPYKPTP